MADFTPALTPDGSFRRAAAGGRAVLSRKVGFTVARLRRVVLERLIRYYRYLTEVTARRPLQTITSGQLGMVLDVDASQVRKDFSAVGLVGVSRVGYDVCEVCRTIRSALGFDNAYEAVLVGAGHLGVALANYGGFERYGLRVVAAFDSNPELIGERIGKLTVKSVHDLKSFVEERRIPAAILTTPASVAQSLADLLVMAGVKALWNFTPTRLNVPDNVLARNEHISVGLAQISFHLNTVLDGDRPGNPVGLCCTEEESAAKAS